MVSSRVTHNNSQEKKFCSGIFTTVGDGRYTTGLVAASLCNCLGTKTRARARASRHGVAGSFPTYAVSICLCLIILFCAMKVQLSTPQELEKLAELSDNPNTKRNGRWAKSTYRKCCCLSVSRSFFFVCF